MLLLSNLPPPASEKKSSMSRRGSTPPAPAPPPPKRRNSRSGNPPPPPPPPPPAHAPAQTMALLAEAGGSDAVHPPGFRFHPTDLELVAGFLAHKVHGHSDYLGADWACSLSAGDPIIPTVDLYEGEDAYPWRVCKRLACLHTMGSTEFYCFTPRRKKYGGCDFNNRSVGGYGTWHGSQKSEIKNGEVVVGYKVIFTFKKKMEKMENTHWVMHEYTLKKQGEEEEEEVHDMVLCRVRNRKKDLHLEKGKWKTPGWEEEQPQPLQEEEARGRKRKQHTRPAASSSNFTAAEAPTAKKSKQQRRGPAISSDQFIVKEMRPEAIDYAIDRIYAEEDDSPTLQLPEYDDLQQQRRDGDLIGSNVAAPLMSTAGGPDGAQCVEDISAPHQVAVPLAEAAAPSTYAGGAELELVYCQDDPLFDPCDPFSTLWTSNSTGDLPWQQPDAVAVEGSPIFNH